MKNTKGIATLCCMRRRSPRMRVLWDAGGLTGRWAKGREATCLPAYNPPAHLLSFISRMVFLYDPDMESIFFIVPGPRGHLDRCYRAMHSTAMVGHSMQFWFAVSACSLGWLFIMEPSAPSPLSTSCNPALDKASVRTFTGLRCCNTCCLVLAENSHISVTGSCNSATATRGPSSARFSTESHWFSSSLSAANMPRVRQRMRPRRGSSSRASRRHSPSPTSSQSNSSATSDSLPRLLHGRLLRSGRRLDSPSGDALPAQSHTALFSFDCALDKPRVTVAISVVFLEEPKPESPPVPPAPDEGEIKDEKQQEPPSAHGISLQVEVGATLGQDAAPPPTDHAQGIQEDFGCAIEEIEPDE